MRAADPVLEKELPVHEPGRRERCPALDALDRGERAAEVDPVHALDQTVLLGELRECLGPQRRSPRVVAEAELGDLGGAHVMVRALERRDRVARQRDAGVREGVVVGCLLQDPTDLLGRYGVGRIEGARGLQGLERREGGAEANALDLGEREVERDLLLRGERVLHADPERLRDELPASGLLVQPRLQGAPRGVGRVDREHLADERERARGVRAREGLGGAHLEPQREGAVLREARLLEQRLRRAALVAEAVRRPGEAEDRAAPPGLEIQYLLEDAGRAAGIADQILPEQRRLLEVRHLPARVGRDLGGLLVQLDQRAKVAIRVGRDGGRHHAGERVGHLGIARRGDPRELQQARRLLRPPELDLRQERGAHEGLRPAGGLGGALGLARPEGHTLVVAAPGGQEAIQLLEEERVALGEGARAVHVERGLRQIAEALRDRRQRTQLVNDRRVVREVVEPTSPREGRLVPVARELVEPREIVEDAAIHERRRRRAARGALEEVHRTGVVVELLLGDRRGLELEARTPGAIGLEPRLVLERAREPHQVPMGREELRVRAPDDQAVRRHPHGPSERALRRVGPAELPVEDERALDVDPGGELGLPGVRVGDRREVHDVRLVCVRRLLRGARGEIRLEALQGRRVAGRAGEGGLPGGLCGVPRAGGLEESRALDEELCDGRLRPRAGDLVIEVPQHRLQVALAVKAPAQDPVGCRQLRVDTQRGLRVRGGARVVAVGLREDRELEVRAREPDAIVPVLQDRDPRREQLRELDDLLRDGLRGERRRYGWWRRPRGRTPRRGRVSRGGGRGRG